VNTHSQNQMKNQKINHVGDVSRPRTSPRRSGWGGGGYYVTPPTTSTLHTAEGGSAHVKPPTSLVGMGGVPTPAQGDSTKPQRSAVLDWFEAERRRLAGEPDVPW
jgi:hypothetical protein